VTFTVARKLLAPALARAAAVVPGRTTMPIVQCLLLEASGAGLSVTATDLNTMYRERIDDVPRESWRGCVDAGRVEGFVSGAPADGEVTLRADEGRLTIRAGRASCRLPILPGDDFPVFGRRDETAVTLTFNAAALAAGLRAVAPAMNAEKTRHYLCGAFLHEGRLCATDGNRLALRTVAIDAPAAPEIIVPSATVERIAALLRGVTGMVSAVVGQVQIVVSSADWTLTSKLIDGEFPD
jgi:DNA polymerase III subunit beta